MSSNPLDPDFNGAHPKMVPITAIAIPEYQRVLMKGWAERIAENWNPRLFRHPYLEPRDNGTYACVDGQHTVVAAELRGHTHIPAYVYSAIEETEAAGVFSDTNTQRRRLRPYDVWKADRLAGRKWAVDLDLVAHEYGCRVSDGGGADTIRCIAQARQIIESNDGVALLSDALGVLAGAWPDVSAENQNRFEARMVTGMADLIRRAKASDKFDRVRFASRLKRHRFRRGPVEGILLTPESFARTYLAALVEAGTLDMPALSTGSGARSVYAKGFAVAIFGRDGWRSLWP